MNLNDDVWYLTDVDTDSQNYNKSFRFDFTIITVFELKQLIKNYVYRNYKTGNRIVRSLSEFLYKGKILNRFMEKYDYYNLYDFCNKEVELFIVFLKTEISENTGKPFSYKYQKACFDMFKALISWGQIYMPKSVPKIMIFSGNEYPKVNQHLKIDYIPDKVIEQIHQKLHAENNVYLKCGICILECTGMRVGDLVLLKTNCLRKNPIIGYELTWFDHKNHKERTPLPIPERCKVAIENILSFTEDIRKLVCESDADLLFIYKPRQCKNQKPVIPISRRIFEKWIKDFPKTHNICDTDGSLYQLTTRKFRRTLATDMLSKGTNIKTIQETLGHASVTTTKLYYADVKDKSVAEMFDKIGILGNISEIGQSEVLQPDEKVWCLENIQAKARLADGYCTMPIRNGELCDHLKKRCKCYTCSRYITTLQDLEYHKSHLQELKYLVDSNIYGEHYVQHLLPVIYALEEIIKKLEELKDG